MLNTLLMSSEAIRLLLEYGLCLIIIVSALIAIGFVKRKTKKEMRAETVKKSCLKARICYSAPRSWRI